MSDPEVRNISYGVNGPGGMIPGFTPISLVRGLLSFIPLPRRPRHRLMVNCVLNQVKIDVGLLLRHVENAVVVGLALAGHEWLRLVVHS